MKKSLTFILTLILIYFFITLNKVSFADVSKENNTLSTDKAKVITDIKAWNHPVKKVMADNKISIKKVRLFENNTYAVFYVQFPCDLKYSSKTFFDKVEFDIARANSFLDYKLVDEGRKISMEVFCDRTSQVVRYVRINGKRNYFIQLQQQEGIKSYHYIKPISIRSINPILNKIIQSGWDSNFEKILAKPDSSFNGCSVYFNKGIKVDSRQKVFNIVLSDKFSGKAVNDITMKSSKGDIIKSLGSPQFVSSDENVYGYKTNKFYIFFIGKENIKEVSIYRRDTGYERTMLKQILDGLTFQSLYDKYEYASKKWPLSDLNYNERGGFGLEYYSTGISLNNNSDFEDDIPDVTVYGNYEGDVTDKISLPGKMSKNTKFDNDIVLLELDKDAVFEYEKYRIKGERAIDQERMKNGALSPDGTRRAMENNGGTFEHAGIFILSVNKDAPDIEFKTPHFPGKIQWLSNRYLVYEVCMYGVYLYDTQNNQAIQIGEKKNEDGLSNYELVSVRDGQIAYRDTDSDKTVSMRYSINKDGSIVFDK